VTVSRRALGPDHLDVGDRHDELGRVLQNSATITAPDSSMKRL
jgi:hypothetical protein